MARRAKSVNHATMDSRDTPKSASTPFDTYHIVDCLGGVEVNGAFFGIDFEEMHRRAEAEEAAGIWHDWDEVKRSSLQYVDDLEREASERI